MLGLLWPRKPERIETIKYVAVERPVAVKQVVYKTRYKTVDRLVFLKPDTLVVEKQPINVLKALPLRHNLRGYVGVAPEIKVLGNRIMSVLEPSLGLGYSFSFTGSNLGVSAFTNKSVYAVIGKEF
jgi:hypothetical protein